jgi:hypothetical protein
MAIDFNGRFILSMGHFKTPVGFYSLIDDGISFGKILPRQVCYFGT